MAVEVAEIEPETGRHIGFENAKFHLDFRGLQKRTAMSALGRGWRFRSVLMVVMGMTLGVGVVMAVLMSKVNFEFYAGNGRLLAAADVEMITLEVSFSSSCSNARASTPKSSSAPMNMSPLIPLKMSR
jgi:hypothetical protein